MLRRIVRALGPHRRRTWPDGGRPSTLQSGAIPYAWAGDEPTYLLITSRRTGRWIFPKGMVEDDMTPAGSAAKEAWDNLGKRHDHQACRDRLTDLLARTELRPFDNEDVSGALFCAWDLPDPTDVPILMGAIEHGCQYLLTLDSDCFGQFFGRSLGGVTVLKPGKFLAMHGR